MRRDKKILQEMQELDQVMNKRLALEKKKHEESVKISRSKKLKRTEFSF